MAMILTAWAFAATAVYGVGMAIAHGNWELVAGAAAGAVGAMMGTALGNRIMMSGIFKNINSPRVRQSHREAQKLLHNEVNFDNVNYHVVNDPNNPDRAWWDHGEITFNVAEIGDDYLQFRRTQAHELYHEFQGQKMPETFDALYKLRAKVFGYSNNIFEVQARNFSAQMTNFIPSLFEVHSYMLAPMSLSISFGMQQPTIGTL